MHKSSYLIENDNSREFVYKFLELSKNLEKINEFSNNTYSDSKRFEI